MERQESRANQTPGITPKSENLIIPTEQTPDPVPIDRSNYWQDADGNWRQEIIEKVKQIQRGQY